MQGQRYSDSYHLSNDSVDESEQSRYDEQVKAELVTNACFYHFLECVTENSRQEGDDRFRLNGHLRKTPFMFERYTLIFLRRTTGVLFIETIYRANGSGKVTFLTARLR